VKDGASPAIVFTFNIERIMALYGIRTIAVTLSCVALGWALCQCGGGSGANTLPLDAGAQQSVHTNWATCYGPLDNSCERTQRLAGKRPSCAASGYCGTDDFCWFTENPGTTCFPPDVAFCDWTADQHRPDCNELNGGWPADASGCGTLECLTLGDGGTCGWSDACTPPSTQ
jgi:hypothetical protein